MKTVTRVAALIICCGSLFAANKKLQPADFPLRAEFISFDSRSYQDDPGNGGGFNGGFRSVVREWHTEYRINVAIEGQHYVVGCTTPAIDCRVLTIGSHAGRWGKSGLEILGTNEHGKPQKTTYQVISGGR